MGIPSPELTGVIDLLAQRYALLEVLGEGGMARVYRAFDHHLRVPRAIKVVHPSLMGRQGRQRLTQEAQLMARLAHSNVVTLFELGEDGDRLFLVMELVEGGSVADRITQHGPLPPRMAARVELGLLSALEFAHAQGIVHRDVKPHNILLDRDGIARVTDFGIARWEEGTLTRTGAILGTLAYMPPEQKSSARKVDARSDLYAAGATFYAMLTGTDPHDLFAAGLDPTAASELLGQLPPSLAPWILRATSFRPDDRFPDAASMAAALAELVQELPEDPPTPPLVARPSQAGPVPSSAPAELPGASVPTFALEPVPTQQTEGEPVLAERERGSWLGYALIAFSLVGLVVLFAVGVLTASSGALLIAVLPGEPEEEAREPAEIPVEVPPVEVPPVEVPPAKAPNRWEVERSKGALTATLQAERQVVDNTGVRGWPLLVLRCDHGRLRGQLETGVEDVEVSGLDALFSFVAVEIREGEKAEGRMFPRISSDPGVLDLAVERGFVEHLLASPEMAFTYTSSSSAVVTATFLPADARVLRELRRCL